MLTNIPVETRHTASRGVRSSNSGRNSIPMRPQLLEACYCTSVPCSLYPRHPTNFKVLKDRASVCVIGWIVTERHQHVNSLEEARAALRNNR